MSIKQQRSILPRIALYKVLEDYAGDEERINIMRKYMRRSFTQN